jgi:16S rRNA (adenine1518-N6/adenine1519-N6)-dimethyltransferase
MRKKSLGQHFLYDPLIIREIIRIAGIRHEDLVVEIGPGPGELTEALARHSSGVIAIELDESLFNKLANRFAGRENISLVHLDALEYPYHELGRFKVVANIPYYITTPIIFRLLEAREKLLSMTLTVQKEVAERIVASPGGKDYGVLSIMVQWYAETRIGMIIPKEAFRPVPKVDSAVVRIDVLSRPAFEVEDEKLFFGIVRAAFSQRRKMLSNSLRSFGGDPKEWLERAGIDPSRRPETLSIEEFARLADAR